VGTGFPAGAAAALPFFLPIGPGRLECPHRTPRDDDGCPSPLYGVRLSPRVLLSFAPRAVRPREALRCSQRPARRSHGHATSAEASGPLEAYA